MSNTWVWNTFVPTPAVPTWFVGTLMAFYLLYPLLLPVLQGYSSEMLQILTILMYQTQFLPYLLIKNISPNLNNILYIHPVFKMPVFIMGISAGLLTLRGVDYPYCKQGYLHFLFPWKISVPGQERDSEFSTDSSTRLISSAETSATVLKSRNATELSWGKVTDFSSVILCLAILYEGIRSSSELDIPSLDESSQLFLCHIQLLVILGLTKDHEHSFLAKICKTRVCQILGKFSMAIFMFHEPVLLLLIFIINLEQEHVSTEILGAFLSILVAALITYTLEQPLYNFVSRKIEIYVTEV